MSERTKQDLVQFQAMPLDLKIQMTYNRIREWYQYWGGKVYVAFSGGKDSTALLHLVRNLYPEVPGVFVNTNLEFPETRDFIKTYNNIITIDPEMTFINVIREYGYPLFSKEVSENIELARRIVSPDDKKYPTVRRLNLMGLMPRGSVKDLVANRKKELAEKGYVEPFIPDIKSSYNKKKYLPIAQKLPVLISSQCCHVMKKNAFKKYDKETGAKPYIGILAEESRVREKNWIKNGCNVFNGTTIASMPLSFWTESDVLEYLKVNNIKINDVYGNILYDDNNNIYCSKYNRTGCIYCAFGAHMEESPTRFELLKETHPKAHNYCINGGEFIDNPKYDPNVSMEPDILGWINWNPKQLFVPNKNGLGMGKIFDMINELMGKEIYKY